MSRRSQGWVVVAFGVVLLVLAAFFDDLWEQVTEAVLGGAVIVVGLALVLFGGSSKSQTSSCPGANCTASVCGFCFGHFRS